MTLIPSRELDAKLAEAIGDFTDEMGKFRAYGQDGGGWRYNSPRLFTTSPTPDTSFMLIEGLAAKGYYFELTWRSSLENPGVSWCTDFEFWHRETDTFFTVSVPGLLDSLKTPLRDAIWQAACLALGLGEDL